MKSAEQIITDDVIQFAKEKGIDMSDFKEIKREDMNDEDGDLYDHRIRCINAAQLQLLDELVDNANKYFWADSNVYCDTAAITNLKNQLK